MESDYICLRKGLNKILQSERLKACKVQQSLAEDIRIHPQSISDFERGKKLIPAWRVGQIVKAVGVEKEDLRNAAIEEVDRELRELYEGFKKDENLRMVNELDQNEISNIIKDMEF